MTYVPAKEIKIKEKQDKFLKQQLEKEREQQLLEEIERTEKERVKKKGLKVLKQSGVLDSYSYLLSQLCKYGLPTGDLYEFSALTVLKYEKKIKLEKKRELENRLKQRQQTKPNPRQMQIDKQIQERQQRQNLDSKIEKATEELKSENTKVQAMIKPPVVEEPLGEPVIKAELAEEDAEVKIAPKKKKKAKKTAPVFSLEEDPSPQKQQEITENDGEQISSEKPAEVVVGADLDSIEDQYTDRKSDLGKAKKKKKKAKEPVALPLDTDEDLKEA